MRRFLTALVATSVLMVGNPAIGPAAATGTHQLNPTEELFVEAINQLRAEVGVGPLVVHSELSHLSRGWTAMMVSANRLVHADPISGGFTEPWRRFGENIGYSWSVDSLMNAFRTSPGHYANLIDPDYNYVGVGVVWVGGTLWTTHRFVETVTPPPPPPPPPPEVFECAGEEATIVGTDAGERIVGTPGRDVIVARGGADVILGRGGHDLICAGDGDDQVYGAGGSDVIYAGGGADWVDSGAGDDKLYGQGGNDRFVAGAGADFVHGGAGYDRLNGGLGPDRVVGGGDVDRCWGEQVACEAIHRTWQRGGLV